MSTAVSTGWTPPPVDELYIDDCDAAAAWLSEIAQAGLEVPYEISLPFDLADNVSIATITAYTKSTLPVNYTPAPTDSDLMAWYLEFWINDNVTGPGIDEIKRLGETFPVQNCSAELCRALKFQGDSDVSGMGMIVTYYIEASLTTVFFLAAVFYMLRALRRPSQDLTAIVPQERPQKFVKRLEKGFGEAADKFLDYTLIFSAGYLLAAMCRFISAFRHFLHDRPTPIYSLTGSVFMSDFSVFPAIALQCLSGDMRKNLQRQVLWALIIALFLVLTIILALVAPRDLPDWPTFVVDSTTALIFYEVLWTSVCDDRGLWLQMIDVYYIGLVFLLANGLWWLVYTLSWFEPVRQHVPVRILERLKATTIHRLWVRHQNKLRIANGVLAVLFMWTYLGIFHYYAYTLAERAGESDKDAEWTFGQILAPVAFAQVIFDLVKYLPKPHEQPASPEHLKSSEKKPEGIAPATNDPAKQDQTGRASEHEHDGNVKTVGFLGK